MKKQHKVVMLPTDNKAPIARFNNTLYNTNKGKDYSSCILQHIYILSDDEIKRGDWYVDDTINVRQSVTSDTDYWNVRKDYKKIIATTDKSLKIGEEPKKWISAGGQGGQLSVHWDMWNKSQLPQIPQQFIEKYITKYNKGSIITDIMVEYEEGKTCLKVTPDNTVNLESI